MTRLSRIINLSVLWWGSPLGVALTALICTGGHLYFWLTGSLTSEFQHYLSALSEFAIIAAAMILHNGSVSAKALQMKLDALIRGIENVDDALAGIEDLPERELDTLRAEIRGD